MVYDNKWMIVAAVCALLAGCGDRNKAPTGQVVATVDGDEVTATDLRNELGGFNTPDPKVRKAAEQQALDAIVTRKLLSKAAEKADVAKTPEFAQQKERTDEMLLVQAWQSQLVRSVPKPSADEAQRFMADNPDMYAARKVLLVDQLQFQLPDDPTFAKQLQPLQTLEDVAAFLASKNIRARAQQAQLDVLQLEPHIAKQILALPPGEVFVVPAGESVVANTIRQSQIVPLTGAKAVEHATAYLRNKRAREATERQFAAVVREGRKEVKYSKAYQPAPPPKNAPAKAAPGAAAAK